MLLQNKVAIITGGAHGMGEGIAKKFASEGCMVAVVDIQGEDAKKAALEIAKSGRETLAIQCDHTDSRQVQDMVDKVMKKFGKIDILVNTAGVGPPPIFFTDFSEADWDRTVAINLTGPYLCCKYVVPHMIARKSGNIINFSSIQAVFPKVACAHYAAAKAGLLGFTSDLAFELAAFQIRVNAILPGPIRTEFYNKQIPPGMNKDEFFNNMNKVVLLGRYGTPEDIAGVTLFLASDLAAFVTGSQIHVGGGSPFEPSPFPIKPVGKPG